jgi:hypothetical protein
MHSEEYRRGYDAGYKQALLDAIRKGGPPTEPEYTPAPRPNKPFSGGAEEFARYGLRRILRPYRVLQRD